MAGKRGSGVKGLTLEERLWRLSTREGTCWVWNGARQSAGYGQMMQDRKLKLVHRVAYELLVGPIPDGLHLDHLCRNRSCWNPAHLEAVTQRVNNQRSLTANARKTVCHRGHPLSGENLRVEFGHRHCRACRQDYMREYNAARPQRAR